MVLVNLSQRDKTDGYSHGAGVALYASLNDHLTSASWTSQTRVVIC